MTPLEVLQRYPAHDYTLHGALASRAQRIPQHSFIEFENGRLSYAETRAHVHQAMALLASYGVKPGDRIAVMAHNHPATAVLFLALASLGAMMVGVNPDFGEKEAHYVLEHSQSSGIVCSPAALATVEAVCGLAACAALDHDQRTRTFSPVPSTTRPRRSGGPTTSASSSTPPAPPDSRKA